jgi:hypothetical protein
MQKFGVIFQIKNILEGCSELYFGHGGKGRRLKNEEKYQNVLYV